MPTLIACLSSGKGTWSEVVKIMNSQQWDKVYLITNQFGKDNFKAEENVELVLIDSFQEVPNLVEQIKKQINVKDFEVALNLVSGTGKEHMAVLEAVLELGLNFRLVSLKNNQVVSLGLERN
ncbi:hypothetical protein HOA91_02930 [Candidatus Woesearchaeota archaeon]|jgi:hypothetical protein|nr:hypothetical protein [Candidatus Woesearchaeota archaeon]